MKRIESGLDEVKSVHRSDVIAWFLYSSGLFTVYFTAQNLYSKQKTDELDAKMKQVKHPLVYFLYNSVLS